MMAPMTKLDAVIERLRTLPETEQDAVANEIEYLLERGVGESLLTPEQWAAIEHEIDNDDGVHVPHETVIARMRAKLA